MTTHKTQDTSKPDSNGMVTYKGKPSKQGVRKVFPMETGDGVALMKMVVESCRKRRQYVCKYNPDAEGLQLFTDRSIEFFEYVAKVNADPDMKTKIIPDVESWALYLGVTRTTIFTYEKRGGEWASTIDFFKNAIATNKKQLALTYKVPPVLAIFDLTNNHGYVNSQEFKLETPAAEIRPGQTLEDKVQDAGLVWDATTGEYIPDKGKV